MNMAEVHGTSTMDEIFEYIFLFHWLNSLNIKIRWDESSMSACAISVKSRTKYVKIFEKKCMPHVNFIDFQVIPTICIYDLIRITNIYKLTCVSYEILSCIFSGIFVKTFAENVERETREYYSLICSDDLNMVKQTSRKCMCVVYSIWRNSSNGRINPECIMFCNFRLFKYHMCARQIYNIFMQFFQR